MTEIKCRQSKCNYQKKWNTFGIYVNNKPISGVYCVFRTYPLNQQYLCLFSPLTVTLRALARLNGPNLPFERDGELQIKRKKEQKKDTSLWVVSQYHTFYFYTFPHAEDHGRKKTSPILLLSFSESIYFGERVLIFE